MKRIFLSVVAICFALAISAEAQQKDKQKADDKRTSQAEQSAQSSQPAQSASPARPEVEYYTSGGPSNAPLSEAVRVGKMLYLSGQLGIDPARGALVTGGIEPETKQAMENIRRILEKHGSSLSEVVKCTVMLADIGEWAKMNAVYTTYFPERKPARSAFATNGLALNGRVEIECMATVK